MVGAGSCENTGTFISNNTYTLDIDKNGDTAIDATKSCTWSTNTCI